ncbi:MAG: S8 family serine peptidase [Phycisphaerales bacterium]
MQVVPAHIKDTMSRTGMLALALAAGTLMAVTPVANAAAPKNNAELKWHAGGTTRMQAMNAQQMKAVIERELDNAAKKRVLVQFETIPSEAQRAAYAAMGVDIGSFLGGTTYFATVTRDAAANLDDVRGAANLTGMRSVAAVPFNAKLQRDLMEDKVYDWMVIEGGQVDRDGNVAIDPDRQRDPIVAVNVVFHRGVDMQTEARNAVGQLGGVILDEVAATNFMIVALPNSAVKALASQDAVQWVEAPLPQFTTTNTNSGNFTGSYAAQAAPYNLDGTGVSVLVYDGGRVRPTHLSYGGRAVVITSDVGDAVSDHATHVACTVGANSAVPAVPRGMAPNVNIISAGFETGGPLQQGFLFQTPGDLIADYSFAVANHGAEITTNSIGTNTSSNGYPCDWQGDYGTTSQQIDQLVRGTPGLSNGQPLRVVWANGNERQSTRCVDTANPTVPSGYHLTAPPSCAKNHITVGAVDGGNNENMSTFSSWGPSDDGRMKPDISAPGVNTLSCGSASDTASGTKSGTSMATPTTTGALALLMQDYKVQYPSTALPRNSTLKTFLAHTAFDRGNVGPDNQFGYGTVRIIPAIELMRSDNWKEDTVSNGGNVQYLVIVPPGNTQPLKVTLAWDDFPSTPNGAGQGQGGLINNLDLIVTSPSNVRAYPWTLQGLSGNPGAPAVQTQANNVDNIEQVYVANPEVGAWLVEIAGTAVPEGPQPFSIAASPQFVGCSDTGAAGLNSASYNCSSTAGLTVIDCGLNTSNTVIDTVTVNVSSTSNPGGVNVVLTEVAPEAANFAGSIALGTTLSVADGDTVTLSYNDADTGGGSPAVVTDTATVDCIAPAITNVVVSNVQARSATVTFNTNEIARGALNRGSACGTFDATSNTNAGTSHTVNLANLATETTYLFNLNATDNAGNLTTDDNAGACYSFTTLAAPDFFTELFAAGTNDLDNSTFTWTPNTGVSSYSLCRSPATVLPVDPAGGTPLALLNSSSLNVALTGGQTVKLYGQSYPNLFVGSNGYLTFTAGDTSATETTALHFNRPRISMLFDDLDPSINGGQVSWKQLADRFTVTYLNVCEASTATTNTFQVSMFFDGRISITYLNIAATDGLAGISGSTVLPPLFVASNLSGYPACAPQPPFAVNFSAGLARNVGANLTLFGGDDGIPGGPLVGTIMSLPTNGLLEDIDTGTNIAAVPYALASDKVRYKPFIGVVGPDSFTFKLSDGGTPPSGGDSNTATASINVTAPARDGLPFADNFPTTTFDITNWLSFGTATIDTVGTNEPSEPNSARFNGNPTINGDVIVSRQINLINYNNLRVKYAFQQTGGGEEPDGNEDLVIDYLSSSGTWTELNRHLGSTTGANTPYAFVDLPMPAAGKHGNFQLRVRSNGTAGAFDDWFFDNVAVTGQSCPGDTNGDNVVDTADLVNVLGGFGDIAEGVAGGDFDANGTTDTNDLVFFLNFFGTTCTP